jgi:hypothetical protein
MHDGRLRRVGQVRQMIRAGFGRTISPRLQIAAEWRAQVVRWELTFAAILPTRFGSRLVALFVCLRHQSTNIAALTTT